MANETKMHREVFGPGQACPTCQFELDDDLYCGRCLRRIGDEVDEADAPMTAADIGPEAYDVAMDR